MHSMKNTFPVIKAFLDTNVLVDFLIDSRPGHLAALEVFHLAYSHYIEVAVSTQSILDASYICGRVPGYSMDFFRKSMLYLLNQTNSGYVDTFDLKTGLEDPFAAIEDNAQLAFAYHQCCDIVITNDKEMLSRKIPGPMQVMSPEVFVNNCRA